MINQTFVSFDCHRQILRFSQLGMLAQGVLSVLDLPLGDDRAVIVDDAHVMMR